MTRPSFKNLSPHKVNSLSSWKCPDYPSSLPHISVAAITPDTNGEPFTQILERQEEQRNDNLLGAHPLEFSGKTLDKCKFIQEKRGRAKYFCKKNMLFQME